MQRQKVFLAVLALLLFISSFAAAPALVAPKPLAPLSGSTVSLSAASPTVNFAWSSVKSAQSYALSVGGVTYSVAGTSKSVDLYAKLCTAPTAAFFYRVGSVANGVTVWTAPIEVKYLCQ